MQESFEYRSDTRVVFGSGSIDRVGESARALGGRHIFIVSDPGIVGAGIVGLAVASLEKLGLTCHVYDGVEENPTTRHVEAGVVLARQQSPAVDLIVGLGGGSAMDCAKGVNFLLTNGGRMEDYWGDGKAGKPMLPSVGIPTTAGTGSEAQRFAVIAQEESRQKMACGDVKARFRTVLLDPELIESAPARVSAAAGMDAVSHAVESYVATSSNPLSRLYARGALRLLEDSFEESLSASSTGAARRDMLLGAHWAGAAIENSMLGAAHACANPLTARYSVSHGAVVGLMLPHVIRYNGESVNGEYGELFQGLRSATDRSAASAAEDLAARVRQLQEAADLPTRLRDVDVTEESLPDLAREAAAQITGRFNPRPVREKELLQLYGSAF